MAECEILFQALAKLRRGVNLRKLQCPSQKFHAISKCPLLTEWSMAPPFLCSNGHTRGRILFKVQRLFLLAVFNRIYFADMANNKCRHCAPRKITECKRSGAARLLDPCFLPACLPACLPVFACSFMPWYMQVLMACTIFLCHGCKKSCQYLHAKPTWFSGNLVANRRCQETI